MHLLVFSKSALAVTLAGRDRFVVQPAPGGFREIKVEREMNAFGLLTEGDSR